MAPAIDRARRIKERVGERREERRATRGERLQRRAQANARRLEQKRNLPFGGGGV
jgi:hypothetical protein